MKAYRGFAARLILWFVLLGVGPASLLAILAFMEVRKADEGYALDHALTAAHTHAVAVRARQSQGAQAPEEVASLFRGRLALGTVGEIYLVDETGRIAVGSRRDGVGRQAVLPASAGSYRNYRGADVLGASAPAGRWLVVAELERAGVIGPLRGLAARLAAIGALAFVLVAGGLVLLARRVDRSVGAMVESLESAARGDFGTQVPDATAAPARELSVAVNEMQSRLAEREAQVISQRQELFCQQCELEKLNARIMAADRIKSEFVANMSHEVRTPLHAVLSLSRVLLDETSGALNEEQRRQVGIIERNGQSLLAMLGDILDFSKIEAGRMDLIPVDVTPGGALAGVREAILPLAEDKRLELELDIEPDLPTLRTDADKLHRLLLNLAHNAVKFTDEGKVTLGAAKGPAGGMQFRVSDSGPGIPPEKVSTIFEPFRQIDSSATRAAGGTGLGLSITRSLVDLLGGRIGVESGPAGGTVFTIHLPLVVSERSAGTVLVLSPTQPAGEPVWLGVSAAGFRGGQAVCGRDVRQAMEADEGLAAVLFDVAIFHRDGLDVLGALARESTPPALLGYWYDPAAGRGKYLGEVSVGPGDNGGHVLRCEPAPLLALPQGAASDEDRESARAWADTIAQPPGEPVERVLKELVRGVEQALHPEVPA